MEYLVDSEIPSIYLDNNLYHYSVFGTTGQEFYTIATHKEIVNPITKYYEFPNQQSFEEFTGKLEQSKVNMKFIVNFQHIIKPKEEFKIEIDKVRSERKSYCNQHHLVPERKFETKWYKLHKIYAQIIIISENGDIFS